MNDPMEYRTLGKTGLRVSTLSFGAAPLGDEYGKTDPAEGVRAVHMAVDQGINFFDVSPYYGRTLAEERLGVALEGRREKVILATKCGRYDVAGFDFSAKRVTASIDESLKRLRTDYVDLFLAHDIEFGDFRQVVEETIPTLRAIHKSGKARFIGITGFPVQFLHKVAAAAPVDAILSYCHYNLMVTTMEDVLFPLAQQQAIGLVNASPLHMGMLTQGGPPAWHPAPDDVKAAARKVVEYCNAQKIPVSQVGLRFSLANLNIATTLVGMSTCSQVEENLQALRKTTPVRILDHIDEILAPVRNRVWPSGKAENN